MEEYGERLKRGGMMGCQTCGVSVSWGVGFCRVSDLWGVGFMGCQICGVSFSWVVGFVVCRT